MLESLQPLHPKLVHFPIALFLTALLLEGISCVVKKDLWQQSAVIVYVLAALITPLVVRTGIGEEKRLNLHHPVLESHEHYALLTMWLTLLSLPVLWFLARKHPRWFKPVFIGLLVAVAVCVTLTGHYGGTMVYDYGVGTAAF